MEEAAYLPVEEVPSAPLRMLSSSLPEVAEVMSEEVEGSASEVDPDWQFQTPPWQLRVGASPFAPRGRPPPAWPGSRKSGERKIRREARM